MRKARKKSISGLIFLLRVLVQIECLSEKRTCSSIVGSFFHQFLDVIAACVNIYYPWKVCEPGEYGNRIYLWLRGVVPVGVCNCPCFEYYCYCESENSVEEVFFGVLSVNIKH